MPANDKNIWLYLAGTGAFLGGLLHVVAMVAGPDWIAFFQAPAVIVESARNGTWLAPVSGMVITGLMWLCSYYAFSGAGLFRKPYLLRAGLATIASVCILRGVIAIPLVIWHPILWSHLGWFDLIASLIWLSIGIFYAFGLKQLRQRSRQIQRQS
jgi:hypothetical protein